jgi:hypothetical protein
LFIDKISLNFYYRKYTGNSIVGLHLPEKFIRYIQFLQLIFSAAKATTDATNTNIQLIDIQLFAKTLYFPKKKNILFAKKVRTILLKSTDVFAKKYGRFYWKVRTVYKKGTMVLNRKNIGIKKCNLFS